MSLVKYRLVVPIYGVVLWFGASIKNNQFLTDIKVFLIG
jgi:hypothetical protein